MFVKFGMANPNPWKFGLLYLCQTCVIFPSHLLSAGLLIVTAYRDCWVNFGREIGTDHVVVCSPVDQ